MTEEYENLKRIKKNSSRIATYCLFASMLVMALWGWTPLKHVIDGGIVLVVFVGLSLVALASAILSVYRGIKLRHLKALVDDS